MHLIWANHTRVFIVLVAHGIAKCIITEKLAFHTKILVHNYSSIAFLKSLTIVAMLVFDVSYFSNTC